MDAEQRQQVRDMTDAMLAEALKPVLRSQTEMRERLIGIDGNGSGREGALQRQDKKLAEMAGDITLLKGGLATLLDRSQSWNKKNIWELVKWLMGGAGVLFAMYLSHRLGWTR